MKRYVHRLGGYARKIASSTKILLTDKKICSKHQHFCEKSNKRGVIQRAGFGNLFKNQLEGDGN